MNHNDNLLGAAEILNVYQALPVDLLKSTIITFAKPSLLAQAYQHYSYLCAKPDDAIFNAIELDRYETQCFDNLYQHLRYLQLEFIGHSELCFYHTLLIVLLRRGYEVDSTFKIYDALWHSQSDYFFDNLSLRWLISAADSFIDFSPSALRRAILMNVVSLINTLKAYETQQHVLVHDHKPDEGKIQSLSDKHLRLYDGLTYLRLGCDDTIEQMRRRFSTFHHDDTFATQFLLKVFDRLHDNPTAYAFFKQLHTQDWGYNWKI